MWWLQSKKNTSSTTQPPQQPTASSLQQPGEQGSEQNPVGPEQAVSAQHAAVINLAGVGSFMQSRAAAVVVPAASHGLWAAVAAPTAQLHHQLAHRQPIKK